MTATVTTDRRDGGKFQPRAARELAAALAEAADEMERLGNRTS